VLETLAALGFRSVRLPVNSDNWAGDNAVRRRAAGALQDALEQLGKAGLGATVDFHLGSGLYKALVNSPGEGSRLVRAAWTKLAPVLRDTSADQVFPELLNEPPLAQEHWLPLRQELIDIVRRSCPDHAVIWGASSYQSIGETLGCPVPKDANSIVGVHYYTPLAFTHQCAEWDDSGFALLHDLPFPASSKSQSVKALREELLSKGDQAALDILDHEIETPWTEQRIENDFAVLAEWSSAHGVSVVINEFGVYSACVPPKSRITWTAAVRRAAERHGFGWSFWELDHGFGLMGDRADYRTFDVDLVAALVGEELAS
jgi:endoglucanase